MQQKLNVILQLIEYRDHKEKDCSHRNQCRMYFQHSQRHRYTWTCWYHRYNDLQSNKRCHFGLSSTQSLTHSLTHSLARLNRQGVGKRFRHHCLLCDGNINLRNKKLTRICSKLKYHEHKERGCSHRNQRRMSFQHSQGYKCTWSCWCHRYSVLKQKKHDHRHLHSSG